MEAAFIAQQFRAGVVPAAHVNLMFCVIFLLVYFLNTDDVCSRFALMTIAAHALAYCQNTFVVFRVERNRGVKDAHRVFMLFSVGNMVSFCIAMLVVSFWLNRYQQCPRDNAMIPPVVYYVCGCIMLMIMVLLHFVVAPVAVRGTVAFSVVCCLVCTRFWGLDIGPETAHLSFFLLFGELIGISVEHILRQSFESSYAAQQQLLRRLEQLDGEKERLDYELRLEQHRATASTAGVHANAAPVSTSSYGISTSSYGTDAELTELDLLAKGSSRAVVKPSFGAPTLGTPTLGAPTLGAPTLGAPTLGAPTLLGA